MPLDDTLQATVCDKLGCRTQPTAGRSAFEVYQAAGDDALKPNHTFIAPADAATAGHSSMLVVVRALRTVPVSAPTVEGVAGATGLTDVRARPVRQVGGTANVLVELSGAGLPAVFGTAAHAFGNRNYHVFLHRAAATLQGQGLADFVLSPVRDPSDGQAFGFD
jgi:hypothetical protein